MKKIIIAIDGYSACGKSTTAKEVADRIEYAYVDTGAMYRAVTLFFIKNHISITNPKEIQTALKQITIDFRFNPKSGHSETYLNGLNVENEIRKLYVTQKVSEVSAIAEVRKAMVEQQREMGKKKGIVMDGRDIGSFVFPDAELKIFMTADMEIRTFRRQQEMLEKGQVVDLNEVRDSISKRDEIDTTRKESPLVKANDAIELDSSDRTINEQVEFVIDLFNGIVQK